MGGGDFLWEIKDDWFFWDGNQIVLSTGKTFYDILPDPVADTHSSTYDLKNRYLWAPDVDHLLFDESAGVFIRTPITDHLNSVRNLVDTSGAIVGYTNFDAYGNVLSHSGPRLAFGFTGRYAETMTGLQYNHHR